MKKQLHIISDGYPYGTGEQFFENEVVELAKKFDSIVIYPLAISKGEPRVIPNNVSVDASLTELRLNVGLMDILKNVSIILSVLSIELYRSKRRRYIVKNVKRLISGIIRANHLGTILAKKSNSEYANYYYSFWMNMGALTLSILKKKGKINAFQFRVNGFDIFDERHDGLYVPYRFFNFKMVKQIFVLSNPALAYLKRINYHPNKLILAHYGIYDKGTNPFTKQAKHHIVSCSNLIPIKRVDKIVSALNRIDLEIEWTHFGGGTLLEELTLQASRLPKNISYTFKGNRPNSEIIDFYNKTSVSLFTHTSETEGLGMSIIEAQSFGIPAIVIGVGGVIDIVDDTTGIVLDENCEIDDLARGIEAILIGDKALPVYRVNAKVGCHQKFDAKTNYNELYRLITNN